MKRKDFLKNGLLGLGTLAAAPTVLSSCGGDEEPQNNNDCYTSPQEIKGPFPHKTPAQLVKENIIGNRSGVPLLIELTIENSNDNCTPLVDATVDLWHCDAKGNYSEYSGQQEGDMTNENFLRGRQTTDADGKVSFISIYPGWYPGRAPHLHIEVISKEGKSLLVTQTAFPEAVSKAVYQTQNYNGEFDTSNSRDAFFTNLNKNLPTSVEGDTTNGYTLKETLKVKA
jgi:protocatechuate 3,4-dioxygenase beta subunit